jgi:hypothetical protein
MKLLVQKNPRFATIFGGGAYMASSMKRGATLMEEAGGEAGSHESI